MSATQEHAAGDPADPGRTGGRAPRSWMADVCLLALLAGLVCMCLREALVRLPTHVLSSADCLEAFRLTRSEGSGGVAANAVLSDPAMQMEPWVMFARSEWAQGRAPLWNPYNGGGRPLLGNYQSALLSPFTWPQLVGPRAWGLLASSALRMFVLAAGSYWFLRELRLARSAALFGSVAHLGGGIYHLFLSYPHVNTLAAAPLALAASERALSRFARGAPMGPRTLWALGAALVLVTLGGHPEACGFALLLTAAWCGGRLAIFALTGARCWSACLFGGLRLLGVGLLAGGLCAPQIWPFLEYLARSAMLHVPRPGGLGQRAEDWPLALFPNLLGQPRDGRFYETWLPGPNYQEVISFHLGAVALLAAALAPFCAARRASIGLCCALALLAGWWIYQPLGPQGVLLPQRWLRLLPINRAQVFWLLPASAAAAAAFDALRADRLRRRGVWALAVALATAGMAIVAWRGAAQYERELGSLIDGRETVRALVERHKLWIMAGLALGGAALALRCWVRERWAHLLGSGLACACAFATGAWPIHDYVPVIPRERHFPRTSALEGLLAEVGDGQVVALTTEGLPADSNMVYGLRQLAGYDALYLEPADTHYIESFGARGLGRDASSASAAALERFGTRWLLSASGWPEFETELAAARLASEERRRALAAVFQGQSLVQSFTASRDGLQGLRLLLAEVSAERDAALDCVLMDQVRGAEVLRARASARSLRALPGGAREWVLEFAPQHDSRQRPYQLRLTSSAPIEQCPVLLLRPDLDYQRRRDPRRFLARGLELGLARWDGDSAWRLEGAPRSQGVLDLDLSYGLAQLEHRGSYAGLELWRYRGQAERAWLVGQAVIVDGAAQARGLIDRVEPASREVLLQHELGKGRRPERHRRAGERELAWLSDEPTRMAWRVAAPQGAWLCTSVPWYPGWEATIDGVRRKTWRANVCFQAIEVPPGEHQVELVYRPRSFWWGMGIALACLALAALCTWLGLGRSRVS